MGSRKSEGSRKFCEVLNEDRSGERKMTDLEDERLKDEIEIETNYKFGNSEI